MVNSPPADSAAATLQPGQVIDDFCLQERLHSGGMAHLWRVVEVNHQGDSRLPLLMKVPRVPLVLSIRTSVAVFTCITPSEIRTRSLVGLI